MAYPPINPTVLAALKRIQEDKVRKPIVVSDPKDPRLKAYQDSLGLYNKGEQNYAVKKAEIAKNIDSFNDSQSVLTGLGNFLSGESYKSKYKENDIPLSQAEKNETKKPISPIKRTYLGDDTRLNFEIAGVYDPVKNGEKSNIDLFDRVDRFKKPQQPVVFQKPVPPPPRNNGTTRPDGTKKGKGFFGEIKRPDGKVSTELSIGVNLGGKEVLIPTMVPSLTQAEVSHLLSGKYNPSARQGVDDVISQKAIKFARWREAQKKPYFATPEEEGKFKPTPVPVPQAIQPMQPSVPLPVQAVPAPVPVKAPASNATPAPVPVSTWGPGPRYSIKDQRVRDMLKAIERMKK